MAEVSEVVPARGSITQVRAALELAGIAGLPANQFIKDVQADHNKYAPLSEHEAAQRAKLYLRKLSGNGNTLGVDSAVAVSEALVRYFMTA